jgi:hypothetical protein
MKKSLLILVSVLLVFGFMACDLGSGNTDNNNNYETMAIENLSIKTTGVKSLYVSNIPVSNSLKAVNSSSFIQTLSYINNDGQNTPFFFVSPSGKNIVLNVSSLQQLDGKRILVDFSSFYEITVNENVYTIGETIFNSGRALIDMESGKVYDFKEYHNIQLVSNDLLFTLEDQTLYKIDLNSMSGAVPLNNTAYNPIYQLDPPLLFGNKVIGYSGATSINGEHFSFDINNTFTPQKVVNALLTPEMCSFIGISFQILFSENGLNPNGLIITDLEGSHWYFTFNYPILGLGIVDSNPEKTNGEKHFIGKLSIADNGKVIISNYLEGQNGFSIRSINTNPILINGNDTTMIIVENGFISEAIRFNTPELCSG